MPPHVMGAIVRGREEERRASGAKKLQECVPKLVHSEGAR